MAEQQIDHNGLRVLEERVGALTREVREMKAGLQVVTGNHEERLRQNELILAQMGELTKHFGEDLKETRNELRRRSTIGDTIAAGVGAFLGFLSSRLFGQP